MSYTLRNFAKKSTLYSSDLNAMDNQIALNETNITTARQDIDSLEDNMSRKVNSTALADVATSGNYNDLKNTPTFPTTLPNPSRLTIKPSTSDTDEFYYDGSEAQSLDLSGYVTSVNGKTGQTIELTAEDFQKIGVWTTNDFSEKPDEISITQTIDTGIEIAKINETPIYVPETSACSINGYVLSGEKTSSDLGLASTGDVQNGRYPVEIKAATDITATILPNIFYIWKGTPSSLTITLGEIADENYTNEYHFKFTSGTTATTFTINGTVVWVQTPSVVANKTYEVSILDGIGVIIGA